MLGDLWQFEKPHRPIIRPRNIKKLFLNMTWHECIKYVDRYEPILSFSTIKHIENSCKKLKFIELMHTETVSDIICNWEKCKQK